MRKALHILTSTPVQHVACAQAQGHDIVLVHGRFDAPTWAYTEPLYEARADDDGGPAELEVTDDDETGGEGEPDEGDAFNAAEAAVPWVEALAGNQKRPVGSRVWRVRRDLGRSGE